MDLSGAKWTEGDRLDHNRPKWINRNDQNGQNQAEIDQSGPNWTKVHQNEPNGHKWNGMELTEVVRNAIPK